MTLPKHADLSSHSRVPVALALNLEAQVAEKPPVGILPLGTGNDLARVLGWGKRYEDALVNALPKALADARPRLIDCWQVNVTPRHSADSDTESGETVKGVTLHNYLGVGVDAAAALRFHQARDANPGLFVSALTNKLLYGEGRRRRSFTRRASFNRGVSLRRDARRMIRGANES